MANGKALAVGHNEGFVKLIFDQKYGELIGAHIIGQNATELIAELSIAKSLETTWEQLAFGIHPHPTFSGYHGSSYGCIWNRHSSIMKKF